MSQPPTSKAFATDAATTAKLADATANEALATPAKFDADDARGLLSHIEGHVLAAKIAVDRGDAAALRAQAVEIAGWGRSLISIADGKTDE